jgi:nitrogen fixation protein NifQ
MRDTLYDWFISHARIDDFDSHALACVLAARCAESDGALHEQLGLDEAGLRELLEVRFPPVLQGWDPRVCFKVHAHFQAMTSFACRHCGTAVADGRLWRPDAERPSVQSGADELVAEEIQDLRELLLEHRTDESRESFWFASILAATALRASHLWEDFGVHNRAEISQLLHRHFPALAVKNAGNRMRWKKFFYKQLCDRAEVNLCKAPNCQVCDEYSVCFGPEDTEADAGQGVAWMVQDPR